jgi:hypothetical protein
MTVGPTYYLDFTIPILSVGLCVDTALDSSGNTKFPTVPNEICDKFYWKKVYKDCDKYISYHIDNNYSSGFYITINPNAYSHITLPKYFINVNNQAFTDPIPQHVIVDGNCKKKIHFSNLDGVTGLTVPSGYLTQHSKYLDNN